MHESLISSKQVKNSLISIFFTLYNVRSYLMFCEQDRLRQILKQIEQNFVH